MASNASKWSTATLNDHLATRSYIVGFAPSTADTDALGQIGSLETLDADKYPHVARWSRHITFLRNENKSSTLCQPPPAGEAAKAAAPAAVSSPKQKTAPTPAPEATASKEEKGAAAAKGSPKQKAEPKKESKKKGKKGEDSAEAGAKVLTPEEVAAARKALLKKVHKAGGKRGVEIEGAADMGGLGYFCTSIDEPNGDLEMIDVYMEAMNEKSDPTEEERKGGSGEIGKMIFSAGDDKLAMLAYVPDAKKGECNATEWMEHVLAMFQGEMCPGATGTLAKGFVTADGNVNKFPLKMKEPSITEAICFLKKKGLFPDKDDDSDDDYIFGDDDFPS